VQTTLSEIKNILDRINSISDIEKEKRISQLGDMVTETIKNETLEEK
jgi:hypothetical protein